MIAVPRRTWSVVCLIALFAILGMVSLAVLFAVPAGSPVESRPTPRTQAPSLVVLVVFDQMRADYLERWQDLFEEDGLRRLQTQGTWFRNCHYPYAYTFTGPGHASLLTGTCPDRHGIINNEWYDRDAGVSVSCVGGENGEAGPVEKASPVGPSPNRLMSMTVGDMLKDSTGGKARVVSLSFKDRSAILPGGHKADACYWLDTNTGNFVTSRYYPEGPHPWVTAFNRSRLADRWLGQKWNRLRPELDYQHWSGPDDVAGEGIGYAQGRGFPHPFPGERGQPVKKYYQAVFNSPSGNDLLLELARRAISAEKLGQHEVPDLLCVSFSSNDAIGHCWGPDSQEVLDVTLRSDRVIRQLLASLDNKVGRGQYLLALTADHGVCPLPEVSRSQGKNADRVAPELLKLQAEMFLEKKFGEPRKGKWIEAMSGPWIYLNRLPMQARGVASSEVEATLAGWLRDQKGIQTAYTRTQLLGPMSAEDEIGQRVRHSFYPQRSGDVALVMQPYHILATLLPGTGTTHGTPHPYDTHVPLLIYGPEIPARVSWEAVAPQSIAAIFARALHVQAPADAQYPVPRTLSEGE